jgi:glycosyltransferase involved in cell wall biosynthesis
MEDQIKEITQEEKIKQSISRLLNKESKFLFFVTTTHVPNASTYEIYFHATTLKNLGYEVKILTDASDYQIPEWIEKELRDIPHQSAEKTKLTVSPEDVLVIPEIFTNVMEQTKNLPCIRILLLQSVDYLMNSLVHGFSINNFNIKNIITTSKSLKDFVEIFIDKKFEIKINAPAIPDYFYKNNELKRPVISLVGRNANEISKVVKLFYLKYPHFSWVTFDLMYTDSKPPQLMNRKDYAEKLKKNFAGVWIDRISSFGTFPLECMAAGTIPIALVPDIQPEYLFDETGEPKENIGIWTNDIYALPTLIGDMITKFLDDSITEDIYEEMKNVAMKYNQKDSAENIKKIYEEFLSERLELLKNALEKADDNKEITE